MFFPTPLPELIFRGGLRQSRPNLWFLTDLESTLGSKIASCRTIFSRKGDFSLPGGTCRADPCAIWHQKHSKDASSSILVSFLVDFVMILNKFGMDFQPPSGALPAMHHHQIVHACSQHCALLRSASPVPTSKSKYVNSRLTRKRLLSENHFIDKTQGEQRKNISVLSDTS